MLQQRAEQRREEWGGGSQNCDERRVQSELRRRDERGWQRRVDQSEYE